MSTARKVKISLRKFKNPEKAKIYSRFFKTGKREYGEGDKFLGLTVPQQRKIAGQYKDLPLHQIKKLLNSKFHEDRCVALFMLTHKYKKANEDQKSQIVKFYLSNTDRINNWDLVDLSAYKILGDFLLRGNRHILYQLAKSPDMWERRISIISTHAFIKNGQIDDTYKIARLLLNDKEDLIHKAVGWMLREAGKKDQDLLEKFLKANISGISRTSLRYAIEKMPTKKKKYYLKLK